MKNLVGRLRARHKARFMTLYRSAISDFELALRQEAVRMTAKGGGHPAEPA